MKSRMRWSIWILCWLALLCPAGIVQAEPEQPLVLLLEAEGAITPAMQEYLQRGIEIAQRRGAEVLIFQLNTPGGSVDVMNAMLQDLLASPVPVVIYVAPRGAMAASAGAIITLAGHAASMAPGTTIGAASPVGGQGEDLDETSATKLKNVMRASVRSLAERRGPEAIQLAEEMIEEAAAVTAAEALEIGLIDFISTSVDELLEQLDGYQVAVAGQEVTLHTADASIEEFNPTFIEQILGLLTNPNIVFLLLSVGVQAILIEISSPGGWVAGFIGAVCLALATYGLGLLPVNWFGLVFLALAFVLFILDIKAPTHGGLTAAGVGSLIVGALVLFNSPGNPESVRVSVPLVVGVSLAIGGLFFVVLTLALRAQRVPIRTGQESLLGRVGTVRQEFKPTGSVQLGGELWSADLAEGEALPSVGTQVEVVQVHGVRLIVRKAK